MPSKNQIPFLPCADAAGAIAGIAGNLILCVRWHGKTLLNGLPSVRRTPEPRIGIALAALRIGFGLHALSLERAGTESFSLSNTLSICKQKPYLEVQVAEKIKKDGISDPRQAALFFRQ